MTFFRLSARTIAATTVGTLAVTTLATLSLATATVTAPAAAAAPAPVPAASASPADWSTQNSSFVQRDGAALTLDGAPFRFNGANAYWLGLDENVGGVDYPTLFRIRNAIDTADEMGLTVLRSHMMTSTSQDGANPLAIMPALGEYNDEAFATIDFAIAYAGERGIRLILPLTDEWEYYHGGHRDFTAPLGLQSPDFFTDRDSIDAYQSYVDHVIGRTNALTGVPYAADPTILAWELGNELEGMTLPWINEQVAFIRDRAPEQLVSAGRRFDIDPDTLAAADLDIVDVHYYPPTAAKVTSDAAAIVAAGKVYIAGEYGSNSASPDLLDPLVTNDDVTGMMLWSLFGHNDRGGFVPHDDGFTLHYPGTTAKMREQVAAVMNYSRALGAKTGTIALERPLITAVDSVNGVNDIAWRGTAGASTYRVEVSTDGSAWTLVTGEAVAAEASPVTDLQSVVGSRYRVVPLKPDGSEGPPSEIVDGGEGSSVFVDPLQSWGLASAHEGMALEGVPSGASAVAGVGGGSVTWTSVGINRLAVQSSVGSGFGVEVLRDGSAWQTVDVAATSTGFQTARFDPASAIRLTVPSGASVESVSVFRDAAVPTTAPGTFSLAEPVDGAEGIRATPTFSWSDASGAAYYRFTLTADGDDSPAFAATGLRTTTLTPDVELVPGAVYRWAVRAVNGAGETASTPASAWFTAAALPDTDVVLEDFESYADDAALNTAYVRNTGGGAMAGTLIGADAGADSAQPSGQAASFAYDLAGPGYAGVTHKLTAADDWWGYESIGFLARGGTADQKLSVQFVAGGAFWEATVPMPGGQEWTTVEVPFDDFAPPSWAGEGVLDPTQVTEFSFYLGGSGVGALQLDDIRLVAPEAIVVPPNPDPGAPGTPGEPGEPGSPGVGAGQGSGSATDVTDGAGATGRDEAGTGTGLSETGAAGAVALAGLAVILLAAGTLLILSLPAVRRRRAG